MPDQILFYHQDQACPAITSSMTKIGTNRYYHVSSTQMDWEAAKSYCGTISPEIILAPMRTPEEYHAAKTLGLSVSKQKQQQQLHASFVDRKKRLCRHSQS